MYDVLAVLAAVWFVVRWTLDTDHPVCVAWRARRAAGN